VGGFGYVEGYAVFQESELFQALGLFERAGGEGGEAFQSGFAVGVEAEVFPDLSLAGGVAVEGDGGAGEVERAAVKGGDDFDGVGVGNVFGTAGDFEGGDVYVGLGEGCEDGGDVFGVEEGFVALDVDVDGGVVELGDGVEAVGTAGKVGVGKNAGPAVVVAESFDFRGVGGDDDFVELRAGLGGTVDPREEGFASDLAEDFAGQAGGGEAGGDDAEDFLRGRHQRGSSESDFFFLA